MKLYSSITVTVIFIAFLFLVTACSKRQIIYLPVVEDYLFAQNYDKKNLRVGVIAGPYGDMFMEAIMPPLERMGYTAVLIHYNDFTSPNFALAHHEIDLNIFQHYIYLGNFKFENDMALSAISEIPTVSMGIYSNKYRSVSEFNRGITVSVPDDFTNLARALIVLEDASIIKLSPFIDKSKATIDDIVSNPFQIRIVPIEARRLADSLGIYDVSVINGNYAVSNGLKLSEALYNEVLAENYVNVIAVRTEDISAPFVRDIINVLHSDEYKQIIINPDGKFADFQRPRSFVDRLKRRQVE